MCACFWWHGEDDQGKYRIFQNGTVCFVDTGKRLIAVTAAHVLKEYMTAKEREMLREYAQTVQRPIFHRKSTLALIREWAESWPAVVAAVFMFVTFLILRG